MRRASSRIDDGLPCDRGFIAIVFLVTLISAWLLMMPFVPAIAKTTINRFHLRTSHFAGWFLQQPIPAMYNLANHYEVSRCNADGETQVVESGMINHFPVRVITFGNGRYRMLGDRQSCQLSVTSSYRGMRQQTKFFVDAMNDDGFLMSRVQESEDVR